MGWEIKSDGSPNLNSQQWHEAKRAISLAAGDLWRRAFWRELLECEERWFAPTWNATELVESGTVRFHGGAKRYYLALRDAPSQPPVIFESGGWQDTIGDWTRAEIDYGTGTPWDSTKAYEPGERVNDPVQAASYECIKANTNHAPPSSEFWGLLIPFEPAVPKLGPELTPIGKTEGVYNADPSRFPGALRHAFIDQGDRLSMRSMTSSSAWVRFLRPPPAFRGDIWSADASYSPPPIHGEPGGGSTPTAAILVAIPGKGALRALTVHLDGQLVFLDYLTTPGDANGGNFVFRATLTNPDDGVDILKPDDIDAARPGRWQRSLNP
jgi:hypothetical protein